TCTHDQDLRDLIPALSDVPERYVVWGEGTTDEMCLGIVLLTRPRSVCAAGQRAGKCSMAAPRSSTMCTWSSMGRPAARARTRGQAGSTSVQCCTPTRTSLGRP